MENKLSQVHKHTRIYLTVLSNLIWQFFISSAPYQEKISEKTTITGSDDSRYSY